MTFMNSKTWTRAATASMVALALVGFGGSVALADDDDEIHASGAVTIQESFFYDCFDNTLFDSGSPAGLGSSWCFEGQQIRLNGTLDGVGAGLDGTFFRGTDDGSFGTFGTIIWSFKGVLGDSQEGNFTAISSFRANCCASLVQVDLTFTVVEGSGMAGLEGICGGGTMSTAFTSDFAQALGSYDFTFSLGDECEG